MRRRADRDQTTAWNDSADCSLIHHFYSHSPCRLWHKKVLSLSCASHSLQSQQQCRECTANRPRQQSRSHCQLVWWQKRLHCQASPHHLRGWPGSQPHRSHLHHHRHLRQQPRCPAARSNRHHHHHQRRQPSKRTTLPSSSPTQSLLRWRAASALRRGRLCHALSARSRCTTRRCSRSENGSRSTKTSTTARRTSC